MKPGDMVKAAYVVDGHAGIYHTGIVLEIDRIKDFEGGFAVTKHNTYVRVLSAGRVMTFEPSEDRIEVINER